MIDAHVHLGRIYYGRTPLSAPQLLSWMNENGIDRACVMAMENPEECHYPLTSEDVLSECMISDRLIPFCNVDPRIGYGSQVPFYQIIREYAERGAKGFGEIKVSLPLDDERLMRIYDACGKLGLPVLIHMDMICGQDELGLPRTRKILAGFPHTNFIFHASHFWAEISGDVTRTQCMNNKAVIGYPVTDGGAAQEILAHFPNAYADMSAMSCYNNLMRFDDHGKGFCERFSGKLIFGTDYLEPGQATPLTDLIRGYGLSKRAYDAIMHDNAARLLRLA